MSNDPTGTWNDILGTKQNKQSIKYDGHRSPGKRKPLYNMDYVLARQPGEGLGARTGSIEALALLPALAAGVPE